MYNKNLKQYTSTGKIKIIQQYLGFFMILKAFNRQTILRVIACCIKLYSLFPCMLYISFLE